MESGDESEQAVSVLTGPISFVRGPFSYDYTAHTIRGGGEGPAKKMLPIYASENTCLSTHFF